MFYTYILQSQSTGRLYIGQTSDLETRLAQHNEGLTPSTRGKGPWELIFSCGFETRLEAIRLERKLKSWKNRDRIMDYIRKQG